MLIGWKRLLCRFARGYLHDILDKTSVTGEDEQVNEKEHHSKGVEDEGKAEDQIVISKVKALFREGRAATNLIKSNSRRLVEIMIELEELIPGARNPVKVIRNVATESVSDVVTTDRPKRSRSRTPVLSQDLFESDGFLMQIDDIEKNYMGSRDKPNSLAAATQVMNRDVEEIIMKYPILLCFQEDNDTFVDRSLMRIAKRDLQIPDVQTPTNTNKGKDVLVEA
ncbi:hypothetical protein Cgig2_008719 [Carnegiea gigantea]|uniref:Uncharacterized protein n=1 Tax=Carnegiea gigantea TaxID=171969 RepID=A0A9Q1KDP5_9CARY|nr:hypothetical protein Cgig2_008719 [Carnegiea gigantea]